jgi:curved DNA-binding protein CbpA
MDSEPLPDHFKALGVERDATTDTIKKAHRKLVLTCHPDKVKDADPAIKQQKADQFHNIQKAYETLVDEKERATYEARLTLEALRKEKLARGPAPASREKATRFETRPSAGATSSRYATEERRPSASYDDDKYYDERERERTRASTRSKYETYSAYPKSGSTPRTEKESSRSAKSTTDRHRAERTKTRDKEERRQRPFVSLDSDTSSADEKARYEAGYKRRSQEEEVRQSADVRRKADDPRRSYEDPYAASPSARKTSTQVDEAIRYQHKSRAQVEAESRPSMPRTSSRDYYEGSRSARKESRPEAPRRSSARPKERATSSSTRDREGRDRDRGIPQIVDWEDGSSRRVPGLKQHSSSPANFDIPPAAPQRSYTTTVPPTREHRAAVSPPPGLHRSQTMPTAQAQPYMSSRSKPAAATRGTPLREAVPEHSIPLYPSVPPPQPSSASKSTKYYYSTPNGSVPITSEDLAAGAHRTVLREPASSQRHRSPETKAPLGRPPIGPNRPSEASISRGTMPPPSMGRSSSSPTRDREERGRSGRPLYGEVRAESYAPRPQMSRQNSYQPSEVNYARKIGPDDVRWSSRTRENDRDILSSKPTLGRTATYAY